MTKYISPAKLLILCCLLISTSVTFAKSKILIAGDSWAYLPCIFGSFNKALAHSDLTDVEIIKCRPTSKAGMRAEQWLQSTEHSAVLAHLKSDEKKEIKVIYLSLGGNDFVNYWNTSLSAAEEQIVFTKAANELQTITHLYHELRPDIKILISGYDYPRFTSTNKIAQYRKVFSRMGEPAPENINAAIVRFSNVVSSVADNKNIFYIQHYGLMHYYIGISHAGIAKGETLPPEQISSSNDPNQVGGMIEHQGDIKSYLSVFTLSDAFHLSRYGFFKLAEHTFDVRIKNWLRTEPIESKSLSAE